MATTKKSESSITKLQSKNEDLLLVGKSGDTLVLRIKVTVVLLLYGKRSLYFKDIWGVWN